MCSEEKVNLQKGMNYSLGGNYSVILMSLRQNAPYADRIEEGGKVLIYEGHDWPHYKHKGPTFDPKSVDQPMNNYNGTSRDVLRDIKPMQEVELMSVYKVLLYAILLIMGFILAIYFWKCQKESQVLHDCKEDYNKSIFQETMRRLQSLQIPNNINRRNAEIYYLELSHIFRYYITEEYFIRATEMTSYDLEVYFKSLGIDNELLHDYSQLNQIADMAKYAGQIPGIDQFNKDKEDFINIIKSFHKIAPHLAL